MNRGSYVLAGCLLGGCFSDPADVPSTYTVGGTVAGMWEGASVTLHLEAGDLSEDLSIGADGTFVFDTLVPEQTAFEVTVATQPDGHACAVDGASMVLDANIDDLAITCAGPAVDVAFSAPITWTFDVDTLAYELDVSTLISETAVTITSPDATALRLDGADLTTATPSAPVSLALGANTLTLDVEVGAGHRSFTIAIDRGAAEIEQYVYGKASNTGAGDQFGTSIAMSGDTLIVGAPLEDSAVGGINGPQTNEGAVDSGAVYVFRRTGAGWVQEAYVKASNPGADDRFGRAVAISGDVLVVGAPFEDGPSNNLANTGAVYVFRRTGTSWVQEALVRSAATSGTKFGNSVAASGEVIAIGAPQSGTAGRAYVFRRVGADWLEEDHVPEVDPIPSTPSPTIGMVAISGDVLVVGAPGAYSDTASVYRRSGATWIEEAQLHPWLLDGAVWQMFGGAVAVHGDTIAVGAAYDSCACRGINPATDNSDAASSGAAYVFRYSGVSWAREALIKASNSDAGDEFGGGPVDFTGTLPENLSTGVALDEDLLVVGAPGERSASLDDLDDNTFETAGAAYVFRRTDSTWEQVQYLKASNVGVQDHFGTSVAVSRDGLAVTGHLEDGTSSGLGGDEADGSSDSGAIYIYR